MECFQIFQDRKITDLYYRSDVIKLACDIKERINLKLNFRKIICKKNGDIKYMLDLSCFLHSLPQLLSN